MKQTGNLDRKEHGKEKFLMVNVTLPADLDEFLQSVGNEARRTGGHKLAKTLIFRGLARVLQELVRTKRIDLSGLKTERDFVEKLREAFGRE